MADVEAALPLSLVDDDKPIEPEVLRGDSGRKVLEGGPEGLEVDCWVTEYCTTTSPPEGGGTRRAGHRICVEQLLAWTERTPV